MDDDLKKAIKLPIAMVVYWIIAGVIFYFWSMKYPGWDGFDFLIHYFIWALIIWYVLMYIFYYAFVETNALKALFVVTLECVAFIIVVSIIFYVISMIVTR